jgi:hypothetical protein
MNLILRDDFWMVPSGTISSKVRRAAYLSGLAYADDDAVTEISKSPVSKVPIELAKHEAAQHKVSREMKRKRDDDVD